MNPNCTVFVINLDDKKHQWESVKVKLKKVGFSDIRRFAAINGKHLSEDQVKTLLSPDQYDKLGKLREFHEDLGSVGAVGCYLSHYILWLQIVRMNRPCIIVEDDFVPSTLVDNIDSCEKYDFVLLHYLLLRETPYAGKFSSRKLIPYSGMFFGTACYWINPQAARQFCETAFPIRQQVDSYMGTVIKSQPIRSAYCSLPIGTVNEGKTSIQTPMVVWYNPVLYTPIIDPIFVWIFLIGAAIGLLSIGVYKCRFIVGS